MAEEFDTTVVRDSSVRAILHARGITYLKRMTAANPCTDTLSITREGDTIPMDHYDFMVAKLGNDTGVLSTIAALYASDTGGMEFAEPIWRGEYAHAARSPDDPWCNPWPNNQKYYNYTGMQVAWGYDVGDSNMIVAVIDNGVDYFRCDLGGGIGKNMKVVGGFDYAGYIDHGVYHKPSMPGIYHGTCPPDIYSYGGADHGTLIAAIIGALTNNSCDTLLSSPRNGMAGEAGGWSDDSNFATNLGPGVSILGYTVTDSSTCGTLKEGPRSDFAASAIMDAVARSVSGPYGSAASVINASWYFLPSAASLLVRNAIAEIFRNRASFVAASGNKGNETIDWPADIQPESEVTAVGAVSFTDSLQLSRASYSNYTKQNLDLVAPGGNSDDDLVYTLGNNLLDGPTTPDGAADAGDYHHGTSFAAPQVAGATALLRDYLKTGGYMHDSPQNFQLEDLEGILKASALDFGYNPLSPPPQPPIDPWCCTHTDVDAMTQYQVGFDPQVGWGLLRADQMFNMLDPAVLGYKLYRIEAGPTGETLGPWLPASGIPVPITIYNPGDSVIPFWFTDASGQGVSYKAEWREVSYNISYANH